MTKQTFVSLACFCALASVCAKPTVPLNFLEKLPIPFVPGYGKGSPVNGVSGICEGAPFVGEFFKGGKGGEIPGKGGFPGKEVGIPELPFPPKGVPGKGGFPGKEIGIPELPFPPKGVPGKEFPGKEIGIPELPFPPKGVPGKEFPGKEVGIPELPFPPKGVPEFPGKGFPGKGVVPEMPLPGFDKLGGKGGPAGIVTDVIKEKAALLKGIPGNPLQYCEGIIPGFGDKKEKAFPIP